MEVQKRYADLEVEARETSRRYKEVMLDYESLKSKIVESKKDRQIMLKEILIKPLLLLLLCVL